MKESWKGTWTAPVSNLAHQHYVQGHAMTTKLVSAFPSFSSFPFITELFLMSWRSWSSHVAAVGLSLLLQFFPHANHLPRGLVMCSIIILNAPKLAKLHTVQILHWHWTIELLHPHSHAHILHLEQLHHVEIDLVNLQGSKQKQPYKA